MEAESYGQPADTPRVAPLHMTPDEFRRAGHALIDTLAEFLGSLPDRPLAAAATPAEVRANLDAWRALPATGSDASGLLGHAARLLFDNSLFNGHPLFFGYITAPPAPIGILGDLLAAAVNANVGAWRLGPMASEIEEQALRWIGELIGYPVGSGVLVSGGNMANIVGLIAARAAAADWDVRVHGLQHEHARRLRIYASAETHTWIQKGTDIAGLGTDAIRWIHTDEQLRMNVAALRDAIMRDRAAGDRALMVIGTAGSVSTGAIDPLHEIAALCRELDVWFHVDGAYGALAAAVPGASSEFAALPEADSIAVDPHKWLYAPLEVGCTLTRHADALRNAFWYQPAYYHFGQAATNFFDLGPQNSRGFRALKVWLMLQHAGREGYVRMIGDDIRLSERLHARLAATPELEVVTQDLSITTFRYVPAHAAGDETYLNRLNEALLERIQSSGQLFVSNAVVRGRYLLRACIVNFHTSASDIDRIPGIVLRLGREVDRQLSG